jgi:hypothetical protein
VPVGLFELGDLNTGLDTIRVLGSQVVGDSLELRLGAACNRPLEVCRQACGNVFCSELAGVACSAEDHSFVLTLCLDHVGEDV